MAYKLNIGDRLPRFRAKDQDGDDVNSEDLLGFPAVVYFYPKDGTSICTNEACSFRDHKSPFDELECRVIGISPDSAASHQSFINKNNINYTLLVDENKELCKQFDVLKPDAEGHLAVERTTFVIDADGTIVWIERPVNVEGHAERVLQALTAHSAS